jgi:phosphotransferase system  glucose/maltose/N-acetylglucosamine-specific IIC component
MAIYFRLILNRIVLLNTNLMGINWFIVSIVFIGAIVLIVFLIKKNNKDEKELEKELNYFKKPDEEEQNDDKGL